MHQLVFNFVRNLHKHTLYTYHAVFDNLFTSILLLDNLSSMGHHATGTVRKDRIKKSPLKSDGAVEKKGRGTFDYLINDITAVLRQLHN